MKNYAPENAAFLLPFQFNVSALLADLQQCRQFNFLKNYVPDNYDGDDYILPLRSVEGRIDFPAAAPHKAEAYKDTVAMEQCLYFREVLDTFLCEKEAIRLMNLPAGRVINTHVDFNCGYEDGIFRVHIPITTNNDVHFILNEKRLVMHPGQAWYTNVNLPHSVANKGTTNRVHLVLDGIRNDWSDALFGSVGFDFDQEKEVVAQHSESTLLRMIEELEFHDSPELKPLIEQYKVNLKKIQLSKSN